MENFKLKKLEKFNGRTGPLVLIIMDGIGLGRDDNSNAFFLAKTPFLKNIQSEWPKKKLYAALKAHGTAVGLPSDEEMGNSEVGHNALGAGMIVKQRAMLAKEMLESKKIFETQKWKTFTKEIAKNDKALHLIGLLSDGYVHSHITHLFNLLHGAKDSGIKKVRVHPLVDGRDVPPQSSLDYIEKLEEELKKINDSGEFEYLIASGGGRMRVTMDRYNSDWNVVKRGWDAHVCAVPEKMPKYKGFFSSAEEAITQARAIDPNISDQVLPSFVIVNENKFPVGKMEDGDGVLFFNFRGDRAIQISRAFDEGVNFKDFQKKCNPKVIYYGLVQYDEELKIPKNFLVDPPVIKNSIISYVNAQGINQFAMAETHKFGHVTFFYCGNRDLRTKREKLKKGNQSMEKSLSSENETYLEVISDPSETIKDNPKMKAFEVRDEFLDALNSKKFKFLRVNFANGDMVGHTGSMEASIVAADVVDQCVKEIVETVKKLNGITIITADHGNIDEKIKYKTSHTLNPVMFAIVDSGYKNEYIVNDAIKTPGLGNVAATILNLLGYEKPDAFMESLIKFL